MVEPRPLYRVADVAAMLNVTSTWVRTHSRGNGPDPEFTATTGTRLMPLWSARGLDAWRAYHASTESMPVEDCFITYSDHNAVNNVGSLSLTWKLWWRCTYDGGTMWWFSTPNGWYASNDDGETWDFTGVMVRPQDYRYYAVNGSVNPQPHVARILRNVERLRRSIEGIKDDEGAMI